MPLIRLIGSFCAWILRELGFWLLDLRADFDADFDSVFDDDFEVNFQVRLKFIDRSHLQGKIVYFPRSATFGHFKIHRGLTCIALSS